MTGTRTARISATAGSARETVRRPLLTTACLAAALASACAGGAPNGAGPTAPSTLQTSPLATATLMIQVDQICAGRESDIRVFVDLEPIGVTNPGEPGVSRLVTIGDHRLSAVSQRGTQWGPFPTTVTAGGRVERLGCMPADAL